MDRLWSCASKPVVLDEDQLPFPKNANVDDNDRVRNGCSLRYALCSSNHRSKTDKTADTSKSPFPVDSTTPSCRSTSGRRPLFPVQPLAIFPCTVRQADPSPLTADFDENGSAAVRERSTSSKTGVGAGGQATSWPGAGREEEITERYVVLSVLGKGTFGRILLAECRATGHKLALKVSVGPR